MVLSQGVETLNRVPGDNSLLSGEITYHKMLLFPLVPPLTQCRTQGERHGIYFRVAATAHHIKVAEKCERKVMISGQLKLAPKAVTVHMVLLTSHVW